MARTSNESVIASAGRQNFIAIAANLKNIARRQVVEDTPKISAAGAGSKRLTIKGNVGGA